MALTGSEWSPADVAAVTGNNDGFGNGNGVWWILLLFILFGANGWGGYGFGNGGAGAASVDSSVQRGFDQAAIINGLGSIATNINDNQLANMQQMFSLQNQLSNCCCDNRLASANLQSTIIAENCADREALNNGVRDIIANQTAGIQTILDKMCQQELDAERRENANLRTQLNLANLAASQNNQTAKILADNARQTATLEDYLNPVARPAYIVQNPNCCAYNNNCACGF